MENTLSTIESAINSVQDTITSAQETIAAASDSIAALKGFLPTAQELSDLVPAQVNLMTMLKFIGIFAAVSILVGFLGRAVFGKRSSMNHALSSAMGIFFILVISTVIYVFDPRSLAQYLSPLPYVAFSGEYLVIFPLIGSEFAAICDELLSMVILAFLVNLLDTLIPKGKGIIGWYLLRFVTIVLAMVLHYAFTWASNAFLPGFLVTYAPVLLLGILLLTLFMGLLNVILGVVLVAMNPIFGALYTFFFSSLVGKQLTKAIFTTLVLTAVVVALNYFGTTLLCIAGAALAAYIPLLIVLLILWYLIGHLL